jgi:hypothetical protein
MKKFITILLLIFSLTNSCFALEIQCETTIEGVTFVVKTSEQSGVTYILFIDEQSVLAYWPIPEESFRHDEQGFNFEDNETNIAIETQSSNGNIQSSNSVFNGEHDLQLINCELF